MNLPPEAIKEIIAQLKKDRDKIYNELNEKIEEYEEQLEPTYSVGDRFMINNKKSILACLGLYCCCLIRLADGGKWGNPVNVSHIEKITQEEFDQLKEFDQLGVLVPIIRYWDSRKKIYTGDKNGNLSGS